MNSTPFAILFRCGHVLFTPRSLGRILFTDLSLSPSQQGNNDQVVSASAVVAALSGDTSLSAISPVLPTALVVVDQAGESASDLLKILQYENMKVEAVPTMTDALKRCSKELPSIVVLHDPSLRSRWFAACESIHALGDVPIVIAFSLPTPLDSTAAFEMGVAAHVSDPTRIHEVAGRVRALLRRPIRKADDELGKAQRVNHIMSIGSITVDVSARNVTVSAHRVHLSRLEFDLLCVLMSPAGAVHSRDDIIDQVWAQRPPAGSRTLDTHVRRLRMKLGDDALVPRILVNVRGVGFRLDPPNQSVVPSGSNDSTIHSTDTSSAASARTTTSTRSVERH